MKSILCIEDDPIIQEFYKNILKNNFPDYDLLQAKLGEEGLSVCRKRMPEIILLDIRLPDIDGLDLCGILKGDRDTTDIPVIIVSALGDDAKVRIRALQAGADAFLAKPFNTTELVEMVNARLRVKSAEDQLKTQNEELEIKYNEIISYRKKLLTLNRALAKAEESERKRISEYLHDELGATLAFANMKLTSYRPEMSSENVRQIIREASELLGKAIRDSRVAIYDISPPILHEMGLEAAINWKLEVLKKEGGIESDLVISQQIKTIDHDLQIFVYRIVSEFLLNVLKHAEATKVIVEIETDGDRMTISVSDNGKGLNPLDLNPSEEKTSLGLHHIYERIESIGGKLLIRSKEKEYTRIIVRLPIN